MTRPAAKVTQANVAKFIKAAKKLGAARVTVIMDDVPVIVDLDTQAGVPANVGAADEYEAWSARRAKRRNQGA
jgi:hypothetical protein